MIFETSNRQTVVICVARAEWTPACEFHIEGNLCIIEADCPEWKFALERSLSKPWQSPGTAAINPFYAGKTGFELPSRHRAFQPTSKVSRSSNAYCREGVWLIA